MMVECIDLPPDALRTPARQINVRGEWVPFIVLRELFAPALPTNPSSW